jgi:hypothetical protein
MRQFFVLFLSGLILSCGGEGKGDDGIIPETPQSDSSANGIIEYELNESRLNAVDFNNQLSLIQQSVYNQIRVLFLSSPEMIDQNLDNTLFELELKSTDLEKAQTLAGGDKFKMAILDLIDFYKSELMEGFPEVLPLVRIEEEERTQAETYRLNDYDEQFAISEKPLLEQIALEQAQFASENNFKIEG